MWKSPPTIAIGIPLPTPSTMYPTWLTAWKERSFLRSCCTSAMRTANIMVADPTIIIMSESPEPGRMMNMSRAILASR